MDRAVRFHTQTQISLRDQRAAISHWLDLFLTPIGSSPSPLSGDAFCAASARPSGCQTTLSDLAAGLLAWRKTYSAGKLPAGQPASQPVIPRALETSVVVGTPPLWRPRRSAPTLPATLETRYVSLGEAGQSRNMPSAAPIIAQVVTATSTVVTNGAGWLRMSLRSVATIRMATSKNGASRPLSTADQKRALIALMFAKSIAIPTSVDKMMMA